jgi:hypothetical protein
MQTLVAVTVLAVLVTYAVEHFGFAIAHSMALLCITVLIAPGTLLVFFNWDEFGEWVPMLLAIVTSGVYYYLLIWVMRKLVAKEKSEL